MNHYALKLNGEYLGLKVYSPDKDDSFDTKDSYTLEIKLYPIWNTSEEKHCTAAINAIKKDVKARLKNGRGDYWWFVPYRKSKGYKQPYLGHVVQYILDNCPDTYKLKVVENRF